MLVQLVLFSKHVHRYPGYLTTGGSLKRILRSLSYNQQLLDSAFVISLIIKVEVSVVGPSRFDYSGAIWKRRLLKTLFLVWVEKTMLSKSGGVIKVHTSRRQTTRPWVSKMADRCFHVGSLSIGVVMWTGGNDTKTISVDANLFKNGAKQLRFRLKTDWCGRGLRLGGNGVTLNSLLSPHISSSN